VWLNIRPIEALPALFAAPGSDRTGTRARPLEAFDGNAAEMLVAADMPRTVIAA